MDPLAADAAGPRNAPPLNDPRAASLAAFMARLAIALVATFVAWHFGGSALSRATGGAAAVLLELSPSIDRVRSVPGTDDVSLQVTPSYETQWRGHMPLAAEIDVPVPARNYTYGLAIFVALVLASWRRGSLLRAVAGCAVLLALGASAVAADALQQLAQLASPAGMPLFVMTRAAREALALAYQLSAIVVPALAPLVAWAALDWRTVMALGRR